MKTFRLPLLIASFLAVLPRAHALPGEAAAVIRHCGVPHAQHMGVSVITYRPQRDLLYNGLTLHFEPAGGGWSFTTAWRGHLPVTRSGLESSLPCFRSAMQEAAAMPLPPVDPTTAMQTDFAQTDETTFGIPHLWLIVVLLCLALLLVLIPRYRQEPVPTPLPERSYRKPTLYSRVWRRHPPNSPLRNLR